MTRPAAARLHVLLAKESRVALVIRHGTAKSVCTLLWDRKTDRISLGQWMGGRIDIRSCDLSLNGDHFLYSAARSGRSVRKEWTVVSKTPYLKALAYYPGCASGGSFVNRSTYRIRGFRATAEDRETSVLRRVELPEPIPNVYVERLLWGGWSLDPDTVAGRSWGLVRALGAGWKLRHDTQGGYRLNVGEEQLDTKGWDWADLDGKRLVWTCEGCLWTGQLGPKSIVKPRLLHDFNGMRFQAIAAPYEGGKKVSTKTVSFVAARPPVPPPPKAETKKKPDRSKVKPDEED